MARTLQTLDDLLDTVTRHSRDGRSARHPTKRGAVSARAANLDMLFLLHLIKNPKNSIRKVVCIPDWWLCMDPKTVSFGNCNGGAIGIRAGVLAVRLEDPRRASLTFPVDAFRKSEAWCRSQGRTFIVCNFGLYGSGNMMNGHANSLLFDLRRKKIERFEPMGRDEDRFDDIIRLLFRDVLPEWTYVGTKLAAPARGPQAVYDSIDGLCVTYSMMYTYLRVQNPDLNSNQVQIMLATMPAGELRKSVLNMNRVMVTAISGHPPGTLESQRGRRAAS